MRKLAIAYANSRKAVKWTNSFMPWSKFKNRLNNHLSSNETLSEYLKMSKKEQNDLKDVGGFVGGSLLESK
ncbi:hypothetical protein MYX04_15275, partial [Nitrospiraceae bacterium AH_259_D15_M11_P09]|nr:hypothetical protein [Nitrospiraceae bacterium AH_259_D15_M11_P09]